MKTSHDSLIPNCCTPCAVKVVGGFASDSVAVFDAGVRKPPAATLLALNLHSNMMLQGRANHAGQRPSCSSRDRPLQQHLCLLPVHFPARASRRAVKRQSNNNRHLHGHGLGPSASTWEGLNQALADEFLQAIKAPQVSEPKVFVFVRHGHSTWNEQSRIQVSKRHTAVACCSSKQGTEACSVEPRHCVSRSCNAGWMLHHKKLVCSGSK